jgi:seryl-tRNA synthetase
MLDINFIKENKDIIKFAVQKKHLDFNVEELIAADEERRILVTYIEQLKKEGESSREALGKEEEKLKETIARWQKLMIRVPNIPDISVPEGENATKNIEVRTSGDVPKFNFEVKNAKTLLHELDLIESSKKSSVLKNDGVMFSMALWQFVMNTFMQKNFTPIFVPTLLGRRAFLGVGQFPNNEKVLQKIDGVENFIAKDSAVGVMDICADSVFEISELPKKFISFASCEGSNFDMEQVILCEANHMTSVGLFEEAVKNIEEFLDVLKLPYQIISHCGGDLGLAEVRKYSVEVWIPSEKVYREMFTVAYYHDFQSRRLNMKYRDTADKTRFVHSIIGTVAATSQLLFAIFENHQQASGFITVPESLRKYFGKSELSQKEPISGLDNPHFEKSEIDTTM